MEEADKVVRKTIEIIEYLTPQKWWIENPRTGYLKSRGILDEYPFIDIDYCQFSDWGYNKPTRFWGSPNVTDRESCVCDFRNCPNVTLGPTGRLRHKRLGGHMMEFSTRMKGRIPEAVVEYLLAEKRPYVTTRRVEIASGRGTQFSDSSDASLGEISQGTVLGGEPSNGNDFDGTFLVDEEWLHPRKNIF